MLSPLQTLYDSTSGEEIELTPELAAFYGAIRLPQRRAEPWVIGNFVSTIDGVAALNEPGLSDGGTISGHSAHDRAVMGLLRVVSDAVVVGAGTLRAEPHHVWTPERICPAFAAQFAQIRTKRGVPASPLSVFVTARGDLDFTLPAFCTEGVPVLVVTTGTGAERLRQQQAPASVRTEVVANAETVTATSVLTAIGHVMTARVILVEGGPRLMADFLGERKLDELFLTLSPQVAGRVSDSNRPGFVAGRLFIPGDPLWARLVSVKRSGHHLFLRYAFGA